MNTIKVFDGFVTLRNIAGPTRRADKPFDADDADPANSARMSFGQMDSGRTREQDLRLAEYLMKNRHCYHPDMEVLTLSGWKKWGECNAREVFMVPDPKTRTLVPERHKLEKFQTETLEELVTFKTGRMSFRVTSDHKMYFKPKYSSDFSLVKAVDMPEWGNFDPKRGYRYIPPGTIPSLVGKLAGFILGDGSWNRSGTGVSFHLKRRRKLEYLHDCLAGMGLRYTSRPSATCDSAQIIYVPAHDIQTSGVLELISNGEKAEHKQITQMPSKLEDLAGLFDGLVNSDGHVSLSRPGRIEFSSTSKILLSQFETLASFMGYDAHQAACGSRYRVRMVQAYPAESSKRLEARRSYFGRERYYGDVFCATTSTGLLMVRGDKTEFGYVCGNSTPMEMIQVWMEFKLPIFVARQFVRTRTQSLNEISARYTKLPEEWYIPSLEVICGKAESNKQGRSDTQHPDAVQFQRALNAQCEESYARYTDALDKGIAPELARLFLHVNHYTHWLSSMNLHNVMHFLSLRTHPHAQYEARVYAGAVLTLLDEAVPELMTLYRRYYV